MNKNFIKQMINGQDLEVIKPQLNDSDLLEAESILKNINIVVSADRVDEKELNKLSIELSSLLSKRFNYGITLTYSPNTLFTTIVVPSKENDINLGDVQKNVEFLNKYNGKGEYAKDYFKKHNSIDKIIESSYNTLNDAMLGKGITIDNNKAKIYGLDKTFNQIIFTDFEYILDTFDLNESELLSCILHEIGHTFSCISDMIYTYKNTVLIVDTIKENYYKSTSVSDLVKVVYEKATGESEDVSLNEMIVRAGRTLLGSYDLDIKNAEYNSDAFATRLGYGGSLTTAIAKVDKVIDHPKGFISNIFAISLIFITAALQIFLFLFGILLMATGVLFPFGYIIIRLTNYLASLIYDTELARVSFGQEGDRYNDNPYDGLYDRYNRVRQQMIATLRTSKLSNAEIKRVINQIDGVQHLMTSIKPSEGMYKKLKQLFSDRTNKIDINYLVEDLMNSELSLSSARLKIL